MTSFFFLRTSHILTSSFMFDNTQKTNIHTAKPKHPSVVREQIESVWTEVTKKEERSLAMLGEGAEVMVLVIPEGWPVTSTVPETEVRRVFEKLVKPYFQLVPEVRLRHLGGDRLRIDYVGLPLVEFPSEVVGFELKGPYRGFKDYTQALKQAIDYRHSVIDDPRAVKFQGAELAHVFVFYPTFTRAFASEKAYVGWDEGAIRVAGKFNVGMVDFLAYTAGIRLTVGPDRLWDSRGGLRADAYQFATHRVPGNN